MDVTMQEPKQRRQMHRMAMTNPIVKPRDEPKKTENFLLNSFIVTP
jgi:hypothetical protein